jgi:mono/diheme cytochrome c family protein
MTARRLWIGLALLTACGGDLPGGDPRYLRFRPGPVPVELRRGELVYNTYCLSCHGLNGTGQGLGPPLLDTLFLAPRLPDQAFFTAVERGVNQRNWTFGAMPPLPRVTAAEAGEVVRYVRWLQQRAAESLPAERRGP